MAILKHIAIKNTHYDAALDYLTMQHDEFTMKPVIGEDGRHLPREDYLLDGINCNPYTFAMECEAVNAAFHKNQSPSEVKAHHYIISFDPRDRDENDLTLETAQKLAIDFAKMNFPGHQALVCAHPDGHNSAGNIHVHIVINSVRALDVEMQDFMERECDAKAGYKHHVTDKYLAYLKQQTMNLCQENSLYQVDLLSPAKAKITDREYWAQKKGQAKLDKENAEKIANGEPIKESKYETDKGYLRRVISDTLEDSVSYDDFCKKLFERYGISVHESRGRISYILPDRNRPIRGRQLGSDYEKETMEELLRQKNLPVRKDIRLITEIKNCIKAQQNGFYKQKVKISNLQEMAKALAFVQDNNIASLEELDRLAVMASDDFTKIHSALKSTESRLTQVNLMIKNTGQYLGNKDIYKQYLNARNKAKFREEHRTEISLYEAARKYLQEQSGGKKLPSMKMLKEEKAELTALKNRQYEEYTTARDRHRQIQIIAQNVHSALGLSQEHRAEQKQTVSKTSKKKEQSI